MAEQRDRYERRNRRGDENLEHDSLQMVVSLMRRCQQPAGSWMIAKIFLLAQRLRRKPRPLKRLRSEGRLNSALFGLP
jgi:hypothetical protein